MMNLAQQLEAFHDGLRERVEPKTKLLLEQAEAELIASGIADRAVQPGEPAPDFTLADPCGTEVRLSDRLRQGPVVLLFVRGGWCPYCTMTLRAYQDIQGKLQKYGASLLAVTPAPISRCTMTAERDRLRFPLLSDPGNRIAGVYRVVYELPAELHDFYRRLGHDLPKINGTGDWRLPLPSTFVIASDGIVAASQIGPIAHRRMEPADALAVVRELVGTPAAAVAHHA